MTGVQTCALPIFPPLTTLPLQLGEDLQRHDAPGAAAVDGEEADAADRKSVV